MTTASHAPYIVIKPWMSSGHISSQGQYDYELLDILSRWFLWGMGGEWQAISKQRSPRGCFSLSLVALVMKLWATRCKMSADSLSCASFFYTSGTKPCAVWKVGQQERSHWIPQSESLPCWICSAWQRFPFLQTWIISLSLTNQLPSL